MRKFNVFLSSAMTGELDRERDSIIILFQSDPTLKEFFTLYAFEEHASPQPIEKAFTGEVKISDILIMLLDKELREAVKKEFDSARNAKLKIFVYIRHRTDKRDEILAEFISQDAYQFDCGSFNGSIDLCEKIKDDILSDLSRNYYQAIKQAKEQTEYVAVSTISQKPWSSSRYYDHNIVARVSESDILKEMDIDQLITLAATRVDETGNLKEALLIHEVILLRDNNNWQAYNNRGLILNDMGFAEDALFSFRRALELKPDSHATLFNIGNYYRVRYRYDEALEYYFAAIKIKPDKVSALTHIMSIYENKSDFATALDYAERAYSIEQDERTISNLCIILARCGREEEAIEKCEELRNSIEYRKIRAYIFYASNQFEKSINETDIYFSEGNMDYDLSIKKVYSFLNINKIVEAISWFKEIESNHFIYPSDYNNIGWALFEKKVALDESTEFFQKAVDADPSMIAAWKNLQSVLGELRKYQDGLIVSNRAINYYPDDPKIMMNRSMFLFMTGNLNLGIKYMTSELSRLFGGNITQSQIEEMINEGLAKTGFKNIESFETFFKHLIALSDQSKNN
ncbi:MAG: tetratricopeptide repeat protein [Deltaproteobacteria bacterium]|nr:tetratricopeptide repeat protein [Deltaproteobacteria bacterium]